MSLSFVDICLTVLPSKMFRLLFGREFRLPELCSVWDALLADSHDTGTLDLVPYVFCAILVYHRTQSECLPVHHCRQNERGEVGDLPAILRRL